MEFRLGAPFGINCGPAIRTAVPGSLSFFGGPSNDDDYSWATRRKMKGQGESTFLGPKWGFKSFNAQKGWLQWATTGFMQQQTSNYFKIPCFLCDEMGVRLAQLALRSVLRVPVDKLSFGAGVTTCFQYPSSRAFLLNRQ